MRLLLAGLLVLSGAAFAGTPLPDAPHVVVSGEGKASAAPDRVRIVLQAQYVKANAAAAKQAVDAGVNGLLALLPGFQVTPADVTASSLSLSEDSDYDDSGRKSIRGYAAQRRVEITLDDVTRFNALIDAGLAAGMNEIGSVTFESTRADALREEARAKAVVDARAKAEGLAASFEASLGAVYSINSVTSAVASGYGATELDSVQVTGSRVRDAGRYLQPTVDFTERVAAVYELKR